MPDRTNYHARLGEIMNEAVQAAVDHFHGEGREHVNEEEFAAQVKVEYDRRARREFPEYYGGIQVVVPREVDGEDHRG